MKSALVLAGGGVAGVAWELGVLRGLQDADPDLADRVIAADLIVGTSAGSAVAAQITSGTPLADLYTGQLTEESAEIEVELDMEALFARFTAAMVGAASQEEVQRAIGTVALDTETVAEPVRRAAVAARLPVPSWPDRPMLLPAIDAESGETVVFTKDSGVALVDAVAASCAVPGIWRPGSIASGPQPKMTLPGSARGVRRRSAAADYRQLLSRRAGCPARRRDRKGGRDVELGAVRADDSLARVAEAVLLRHHKAARRGDNPVRCRVGQAR